MLLKTIVSVIETSSVQLKLEIEVGSNEIEKASESKVTETSYQN